jgi:hypothetical protein
LGNAFQIISLSDHVALRFNHNCNLRERFFKGHTGSIPGPGQAIAYCRKTHDIAMNGLSRSGPHYLHRDYVAGEQSRAMHRRNTPAGKSVIVEPIK